MSAKDATSRLASYVAALKYEDLPEAVVAQAKVAIRDSLGCLLGGSTLAAGQQLSAMFLSMAADGQATAAGSRRRAPAPIAGYINAQLTNLLDFDDTLVELGSGHPGATIIPAALAVGEEESASGKDLIVAVVAGYDVHSRVGAAGKPTFARSKQVRGHATWQTFGAVTAAARSLGLSSEAVARAFGLAALHAPVPSVGKIYEERPMWALKNNFGWATMGGMLAALLAADGLDANHQILDGETGFWAMAGSDQCDSGALVEGLGSDYRILQTSFKPYPSCRFTHSALDAVDQIVQGTGLAASQVRTVRIQSSSKIRVFADYRPKSFIDSQFSLPYLVAMMLLRVPPGYDWLEGERWRDAEVLALAERVMLEVDPGTEEDLARGYMHTLVTVELDDGRVERAKVPYARGDPRNPLSPPELQDKFMALVKPVLDMERARELNALIERLEDLIFVQDLTEYLA